MAPSRRSASRHDPPRVVAFDEQRWPIYLLLLIMTALAAGAIALGSSFEFPIRSAEELLASGWTRLALLAVLVGLSVWILGRLESWHVRRGVQLAGLLSLCVHLLLTAALYSQKLPNVVQLGETTRASAEPEAAAALDFKEPTDSPPAEVFERPLAVEAPQQAGSGPETPESAPPTPLPIESGPLPDLETADQPIPKTIHSPQMLEALPRRGAPSQLSRQDPNVESPADDPIIAPQVTANDTPAVEPPSAPPNAPVERQAPVGPKLPNETIATTSPIAVNSAQIDTPRRISANEPPPVQIPQTALERRATEAPLPILEAPSLPQTEPSQSEQAVKSPAPAVAARSQDPAVAALPLPRGLVDVSPATQANNATSLAKGASAKPGREQSVTIDTRGPKLARSAVGEQSAPLDDGAADAPQLTDAASDEPGAVTPRPASGRETARSAPGLAARLSSTPADNLPDQIGSSDVRPSSPAASRPRTMQRGTEADSAAGAGSQRPSVDSSGAAGRLARSTAADVPVGNEAPIEAPVVDAGEPSVAGSLAPRGPADAKPDATRRGGGLPLSVTAPLGPGGLGFDVSPKAGSLSRHARPDSDLLHTGVARLPTRQPGGPANIDGRAREPAEAYAQRRGKRFGKAGGSAQPAQPADRAVELGLGFLARHQSPDGSWSFNYFSAGRPGYEKESARLHSDTAATGLALLAFLGAGYDHFDDQYQKNVRLGLEYLRGHQKPDGDLYVPQDAESNQSMWLYSHGIATIALCEAYGMTGDRALREPAQRAVDFIVSAQDPVHGGWKYSPRYYSDTSVSGWQLMALKSGELAGLKVPAATYQRAKVWLSAAQIASPGGTQYAYDPYAPDTRKKGNQVFDTASGRKPTMAMTAVGLLMRLYLGSNRNDPQLRSGADYLMRNLPAIGAPRQPLRDTYYWYYATQVMFHMRGEYWRAWQEHLESLLVDQQIGSGLLAGSWDPGGVVPDRWAAEGGRIYVTTLNLLSLEVEFRHLPIYEATAK